MSADVPLFFFVGELPQSKPDGFAGSLGEGGSGMAGRFLIAFDALALRATACALSVTAYAVPPLPKGEARALPETFSFFLAL